MTGKRIAYTAIALAGLAAVGVVAWDRLHVRPPALAAAEAADPPKAPDDKGRAADGDAVRAAMQDFAAAFAKGDAKALAALWTEEGEYVGDDGASLHGRAELEDGYSQFFKKHPDVRLELTVDSVRFVSHGAALVEGAARTHTADKAAEPTSSRVSALLTEENGKWLVALLREWPDDDAALRDVD